MTSGKSTTHRSVIEAETEKKRLALATRLDFFHVANPLMVASDNQRLRVVDRASNAVSTG